MNQIVVQPGKRSGQVEVPFSKSHLHRLMIADFLAGGADAFADMSASEDVAATHRCLRALSGRDDCPELPCGESGSTLRFLMPLAMALHDQAMFTATGRLPQRPVEPFLELLANHGVSSEGCRFPLNLHGRLLPGCFALPGNISSQIVTGLLLALPLLGADSRIELTSPLESSGYVDMTLDVLRLFSVKAVKQDGVFAIPGRQRYVSPGVLSPERDWSGATFWLALNHLGSNVKLMDMNPDSAQPDKAFGDMLQNLGGEICVSQCPDCFPALAIAAGAHHGTTAITGIRRLRFKESDRLAAMANVLNLFGVASEIHEDVFIIHGSGPHFKGSKLMPTFNDHRIAMAAAVGATIADGPVAIQNPQCVRKSYPDFFLQLDATR